MKSRALFIFILLSLALAYPYGLFAKEKDSPTKVKKNLQGIQQKIKKLEEKLYHDKDEEKALHKHLAKLDKETGEVTKALSLIQVKMAEEENKIKKLHAEYQLMKNKYTRQQQAITHLIRNQAEQPGKEKLQLLFSHKSLNTLSRMDHYYGYFYAARTQQIQNLLQQLNVLNELEKSLTATTMVLQQTQQQYQTQKTVLEKNKSARKAVLAKISSQLKKETQELAQLQQQEKVLNQLFATLSEKIQKTPVYSDQKMPFSKMKKKLYFPIQTTGAKLTTHPHLSLSKSKKTYIRASLDTPVYAIAPGRVVFADWLRGIGLLLIIDHGNGYLSLYGNNQNLYKSLGDQVNMGEMIAHVGESGGQAEPGLYFEIRKDSKSVDPTLWFA